MKQFFYFLLSVFLAIIFSIILVLFNLFFFQSVIFNQEFNSSGLYFFTLFISGKTWFLLKFIFIVICFLVHFIFSMHLLYFSSRNHESYQTKTTQILNSKSHQNASFKLLVGIVPSKSSKISQFKNTQTTDSFSLSHPKKFQKIFVFEKGLYQNFLITGSIGSGKTSSAMYPFTQQLLKLNSPKLSFLILDVKGNYYKQVAAFAEELHRKEDIISINLNGSIRYNPLNKPNLKASVLANRLKTILLLFSPNNSESYWLDKAEQILEACITLLRAGLGYVTFYELHKLICDKTYYSELKVSIRTYFLNNSFSKDELYSIYQSIVFLEKDYYSLDERNYNLLKSEITRITTCFVSDFAVKNTFCPKPEEESFAGFDEVLESGKIVVLDMNIAEYKNLSKIIAAYLKLDFQSSVLARLASKKEILPCVFISDEYQEYVTANDAEFFAQSREAKCINIISTQSYSSIQNTLKDQTATKVIIQNLINKIWFRTDDIFTIEDAQKQIGKEDKKKISKTYSENSKESNYSKLSKKFISYDLSISESVNSYMQNDYVVDYNFFTQELKTFEALCFLSNGHQIMKPTKLLMLPYFKRF